MVIRCQLSSKKFSVCIKKNTDFIESRYLLWEGRRAFLIMLPKIRICHCLLVKRSPSIDRHAVMTRFYRDHMKCNNNFILRFCLLLATYMPRSYIIINIILVPDHRQIENQIIYRTANNL